MVSIAVINLSNYLNLLYQHINMKYSHNIIQMISLIGTFILDMHVLIIRN